MQRAMGVLVLLAVGGLVVGLLMALGGMPQGGARGTAGGWLPIEPVSFVAGFAVAVLGGWLRRLPWGHLAEAFGTLFRTWRRNAGLVILAAMFAGILLFY